MSQRFRFTIGDLLFLILVSGVGFAGVSLLLRMQRERDVGEVAFWLVALGFVTVLYLVYRFVSTRETRLILLGLGVGFAAATDTMYLSLYLAMSFDAIVVVGGLMGVAMVLVGGGVVHGLISHWHELKSPLDHDAERTASS